MKQFKIQLRLKLMCELRWHKDKKLMKLLMSLGNLLLKHGMRKQFVFKSYLFILHCRFNVHGSLEDQFVVKGSRG